MKHIRYHTSTKTTRKKKSRLSLLRYHNSTTQNIHNHNSTTQNLRKLYKSSKTNTMIESINDSNNNIFITSDSHDISLSTSDDHNTTKGDSNETMTSLLHTHATNDNTGDNIITQSDDYSETTLNEVHDNDTSSDYDFPSLCGMSDSDNSDSDSSNSHKRKRTKLDPYKLYKQTSYMKAFIEYYIGMKTEKNRYEINRIINMLTWTYSQNHSNQILPIKACQSWTYSIFTKYLQTIYAYITQHLRQTLQLEYTTIQGFLINVLHVYYTWFNYIRSGCGLKYILIYEHRFSYDKLTEEMRKWCTSKLKKNKLTKKTKKWYIENRGLPEGDNLTVMIGLIEKEYHQFLNMDINGITARAYIWFLQLLCASFYIGAQGRVKAIQKLKYQDVHTLLDETTYHESEDFKTSSSLGIQPVVMTSLGRLVYILLFIFIY